MISYIVRRLLQVIPIAIGVAFIVFLIFDSGIAGDPIYTLIGKKASAAQVARLRIDMGYADPWYERFLGSLWDLLRFDFGRSFQYRTEISEMIWRGAIPSLTVTLPAYAISTVIAVSLALFCAAFRGGKLDRVLLIVAAAMMSVSSLVYIIFGQFFFAHVIPIAPVGGYEHGFRALPYVMLPIVIWVFLSIAPDLRFYRASLLEEVGQDYVRTARSKGLSERRVLFVHVLRNGMIPILTRVVVVLPFLFTGSLLIEQFFNIPGLGFMVVNGVITADLPVVRAMAFLFAILYVIANLLTDVMYAVVDPRVRLS
jgi:peptide/nickel transport system permease protein